MRILLVGHDATRTGAPRFLLNFARWLKGNEQAEFEIILGNRGPLLSEYEAAGKVTVWKEIIKVNSFRKKVLRKIFGHDQINRQIGLFIKKLSVRKFDVIFCNTSVNGNILERLAVLQIPIVTRVPELQYIMESYYSDPGIIEKTFRYSKEIIAVSQSVKDFVAQRFHFQQERIQVCYGRVPVINTSGFNADVIKEKLGITRDSIVVGGCGGFEWRKGIDIFLALAYRIGHKKALQHVKFLWVGGGLQSNEYKQIVFEIKKLGLDGTVIFTGSVANPHEYMSIYDIFLMTSREDPFPLVNLEVAQLGIPILGFSDTGGTPELLQMAGITPVPYGDIQQMEEAIMNLIQSEENRKQSGDRLKNLVNERFSFDDGANVIFGKLKDVV